MSLRVQHIDSTDKLTAHVILYKFKSDLHAGNGREEWGRPAKYTKREAHFLNGAYLNFAEGLVILLI